MSLGLLGGLAWRDCRDEWPSAVCMLLSVAAMMTPLLILLSIRAGVIGQMRAELTGNPGSRELITVGEPRVAGTLLQTLRQNPAVGFVAPRTRLLSAGAIVRNIGRTRALEIDMMPSGPGDPLIRRTLGDRQVALTDSAARAVDTRLGDIVLLEVNRVTAAGEAQRAQTPLQVVDIIAPALTRSNNAIAYVPAGLVIATERWREDSAVPNLAAALAATRGAANGGGGHKFAGLRIYARSIDDVETVRNRLLTEGIETESRAGDIRLVRRLDQSIRIFIGAVGTLIGLGMVIALAAIQWGWVERRKFDYSYLRLLGLSRTQLFSVPMIQAIFLVVPGILLAAALTIAAQNVINSLFAGQVVGINRISELRIADTALLGAVTALAAVLAAVAAARNAARSDPVHALRNG